MKIQQNKNQFVVTIPVDVMRLLKWNKGTEIVFIPKENGVEVKKLENKLLQFVSSQQKFIHKIQKREERELESSGDARSEVEV